MTFISMNDELVDYLQHHSTELAASVSRYPLRIVSPATLLNLQGCCPEIPAAAASVISAMLNRPKLHRMEEYCIPALSPVAPNERNRKFVQLLCARKCTSNERVMDTPDDAGVYSTWTLQQLRSRCESLTLKKSGTKVELAARLVQHDKRTDGQNSRAVVTIEEQQSASACKRPRVEAKSFASAYSASNLPPAPFTVVVDHRERLHGDHAAMIQAFSDAKIQTISAMLPCGDFLLLDSNGSVLPVVVERKTAKDLISSAITSRYDTQKRLMRFLGLPKSYLIVEGHILDDRLGEDRKKLQSAILSTSRNDGIHVINTLSIDDTVRSLRSIARLTMSENTSPIVTLDAFIEKSTAIRQALEDKSIFPRMLCHVHRCTGSTAENVATTFKSFVAFHEVCCAAIKEPGKADDIALAKKFGEITNSKKDAAHFAVFFPQLIAAELY